MLGYGGAEDSGGRRRKRRGKASADGASPTVPVSDTLVNTSGYARGSDWRESHWAAQDADDDDEPWGGWDEVAPGASSSGAGRSLDNALSAATSEPGRLAEGASTVVLRQGLLDRVAEVNRAFSRATVERSRWRILQENRMLELELQRARLELEARSVENEWLVETEHWRKEVRRLRVHVEDNQQRELEAIEAEWRRAEAEQNHLTELQAEDALIKEAEQALSGLAPEKVRCEAISNEMAQENVALRQRLEQQAVLGFAGGGTAHLFVAALPALEQDVIHKVRLSIDAQLRMLQATDGA